MISNTLKHILGLEFHQENRYTGNRQTDTQPDYRMPSFVHAHQGITRTFQLLEIAQKPHRCIKS